MHTTSSITTAASTETSAEASTETTAAAARPTSHTSSEATTTSAAASTTATSFIVSTGIDILLFPTAFFVEVLGWISISSATSTNKAATELSGTTTSSTGSGCVGRFASGVSTAHRNSFVTSAVCSFFTAGIVILVRSNGFGTTATSAAETSTASASCTATATASISCVGRSFDRYSFRAGYV